ncbi:MAG TPA: hypothetical protein IAA13_05525 [Candidatus Alistipes merdigallinarum]|nr:hypothetical protein [Candidatus Alistipes merdigallinarum]
MNLRIRLLCVVWVSVISVATTVGGQTPKEGIVQNEISPLIQPFGDQLVATDALGRELPTYEEVGDLKPDRYVGLFYWLWHGGLRNESTTDYNVTEALKKDPSRTQWQFADYYWAEPELGYYRSIDEYALQKHLNLFCLIGIDFLYLDFTNAVIDNRELHVLLSLILDMKQRGYNPPRIVPFFNFEPVPKIEQFYSEFYSDTTYRDCWFIYDGKPLVLSPEKHPSNQQINDSFTWRRMWAAFEANEENKDKWRFFDEVPMSPTYRNGKIEQAVVSPGKGGPLWNNHIYGSKSSTSTSTPVYDQYWKCEHTGEGLYFEEQWTEAHRLQPLILCVTGWNEWKAGAWHADAGLVQAKFTFQGRVLKEGESYFVDEFNEEFNRDLEPQKGGYTDNYFYQLAGHLRRYKGMAPPPKYSGPKKIAIDGVFKEWKNVLPRFDDFVGELKNRDAAGAPLGIYYTNHTVRNDIVESRVTYDREHVYFYVRTAEPLTSWNGMNWMMLYIDSDRDKRTGWEGYDFVVNMEVLSPEQTTLKRRTGDGWETVERCAYRYDGCELELAVPRRALRQSDGKPDFYFHWVDNIQKLDDINEFFVNGESAPERRYNYHYQAR